MKMAYGYARVSTHRQRDKGISLEYQKERTFEKFDNAFSDTHIWGDVYVDGGVSASKRQVLQRRSGLLLHQHLNKGDVLIVTRISRICRSMHDFIFMLRYWEERGISFVCCDDPVDTSDKSPFGRFVVQLMGSLAELESAMLGERLSESHASRRKAGLQACGGHPLLYEWGEDKKLYPFEPEITAAKLFHKMITGDGFNGAKIYSWCLKHRYYRTRKAIWKEKNKWLYNRDYSSSQIIYLAELHRRFLWLSARGVDVFGREYTDATARRETPMIRFGVMPKEMFRDPLMNHGLSFSSLSCTESDS